MSLQTILGNIPIQRFVADYYQRLPYSAPGQAGALRDLGSWESMTTIIAKATADVMVCRRDELYTGATPHTAAQADDLVAQGYTLLVRHAEQHDERLAELAASFARDFASPVNIHLYCTPGGQFGFGWHYDAEEVFIIQTTGHKEYQIRKNTVNPWPIEESLPADLRYEREIMPLMRCELAADDWLYIPSGYWHRGESRETSISLAIGVQPRTALDIFDFLRPMLAESLFWRQRLPVSGTATALTDDELRQMLAASFQQLGDDLLRRLADPQQVDKFLTRPAENQSVRRPERVEDF